VDVNQMSPWLAMMNGQQQPLSPMMQQNPMMASQMPTDEEMMMAQSQSLPRARMPASAPMTSERVKTTTSAPMSNDDQELADAFRERVKERMGGIKGEN